MINIPLAQFITAYENGDVEEVIVVKDKIYGRYTKGDIAGDYGKGYIIVYADIPP